MSRQFPDTSGITVAIGGAGVLGGAWSFAAIVKQTTTGTHSLISLQASGGNRGGMWITNTGLLNAISNAGNEAQFGITLPLNVWVLVAVTRVAGSNRTPRGHMYRYDTGVWAHAAGNATIDNDNTALTHIELGRSFSDWFYIGLMANAGAWNRALSDVEVEGLELALQAWVDSTPVALWPLNQASTATAVQDIIGTADQTAITGTSVSADEPAGWSYTLGGTVTDLVVANAVQAQTAGNVALTQTHALTVDGAVQAQTADNVTLTETPTGVHLGSQTTIRQTTSSSTVVATKPAGLAVGDLLLVNFSANTATVDAAGVPTGWSLHYSNTTFPQKMYVYSKVADAGDVAAASWTWTLSAAAPNVGGLTRRFTGVEPTSVWASAQSVAVDNVSSATWDVPAITTIDAGASIVGFATEDSASTIHTLTPAQWIEDDDSGGTSTRATVSFHQDLAAAGSSGILTITIDAARTGKVAWMRALRPLGATSDTLTVDAATQAQTAGNVVLTQTHLLTVDGSVQAQTAGNVTLTQTHVLTVADAVQAQTAGNVTFTAAGDLVVADATQAQTAGNVALTQTHVLTVDGSVQAQTAESPALTQIYVLAVIDAVQAQTAENVSLVGGTSLAIAAATQAQTAGNVALTQTHVLAVIDAVQAQTAGNVVLTQTHLLTVDGSVQAQTADTPTLALIYTLTVDSAAHAQTAGSVTLTQVSLVAGSMAFTYRAGTTMTAKNESAVPVMAPTGRTGPTMTGG